MFCLDLNHFRRKCKHTHILGLELLVVLEDPSHQSQTSQAFVGYLLSLYFPAGIFQANLQTLFELTYMALFLVHIILVYYPPCIDGTMLVAVTVPISVYGSRVMSLSDKFLTTTVTPVPPGLNSEVFPGTNTLIHLGEGSTNT